MEMTRRETTAVETGRKQFRDELEAAKGREFDVFQAKASGAFWRVSDPDNWKVAVDSVIACPAASLGFILEAVVFFTGSVPSVEVVGRGRYRVTAIGYYAAIGA